MAFVELKDVRKSYHMGEITIHAVDGISFTIEKGEFVVIVGPSGAGKTTVSEGWTPPPRGKSGWTASTLHHTRRRS